MLLAMLAIAAELPDDLAKLDRCRAAVHGELATAAEACRPSSAPISPLEPGLPSICRAALSRGHQAGKLAGLPAPSRAGLVRHFDEADRACRAPAPAAPPIVDQVKPWQ